MVRAVCLKHDETKQSIISAVNSDIRLYTFRQGKEMSCDEYLKLFRAHVDTINAHGAVQVSTGVPTSKSSRQYSLETGSENTLVMKIWSRGSKKLLI